MKRELPPHGEIVFDNMADAERCARMIHAGADAVDAAKRYGRVFVVPHRALQGKSEDAGHHQHQGRLNGRG